MRDIRLQYSIYCKGIPIKLKEDEDLDTKEFDFIDIESGEIYKQPRNAIYHYCYERCSEGAEFVEIISLCGQKLKYPCGWTSEYDGGDEEMDFLDAPDVTCKTCLKIYKEELNKTEEEV